MRKPSTSRKRHKTPPGPSAKRSRKPVQTGHLIADQLRRAAEKRGFAQVRLLTEWDAIVGADLAKLVQPQKVGYAGRSMGATLHVVCAAGAATEVQMQAEIIRERVNACYGYNAIATLRIVNAGGPMPGHGSKPVVRERRAGPRLSPQDHATLRKGIETVEDDGLRAALASLSDNVRSAGARSYREE